MRALVILTLGVALLAAFLAFILRPAHVVVEAPRWVPARFSDLTGWSDDDESAALAAFLRSCARFDGQADTKSLGPYGTVALWRPACAAGRAVPPGDTDAARHFFQTQFVPFKVENGSEPEGTFTGYYTPRLKGSLTPNARFHVPLLARPDDLVMVDLGQFRPELKGQRIAGRVRDGSLVPYADRAALEAELATGASARPVVLWLEDPVDAFFLHIQGSGEITLETGGTVRAVYDGQNGYPYTPIGRILRDDGAIEKGKVSMQSIRAWLETHADQAQTMMNNNASFVFFRILTVEDPSLGPPGAQGVPVTPGRTLAVDDGIHAYGVPMWIETEPPAPDLLGGDVPIRRLMIAQDTGGAILGAVRGDYYWGTGDEAGGIAGKMAAKGTMTVLVPPAVAPFLMTASEGK